MDAINPVVPDHVPISAVIPTYNRENTISRAVRSVLAQERPAREVIVVDDGSTDNTQNIIEPYCGRIRYVHQKNMGVSAARNRGVTEAKYDWVAFLDSDDYWQPHHLKRIADAIKATKGRAALYFSDVTYSSGDHTGSLWDRCGFRVSGKFLLADDASEWAFMTTQPIMIQSSVIRRDVYLNLGGLPPDMVTVEDTLLFYKLCLTGPACAVSNCGAVITSDAHVGSRLTKKYHTDTTHHWRNVILMHEQLRPYLNRLSDENRRILAERHIASYLALGKVLLKQHKIEGLFSSLMPAFLMNPALFGKIAFDMMRIYLTNRLDLLGRWIR